MCASRNLEVASNDAGNSIVRDNVFGTMELLENILMRLPPKELLQAQRAERHWRVVVVGFSMLRKELFFIAKGIKGERNRCPEPIER